jgi:hypothetical protein
MFVVFLIICCSISAALWIYAGKCAWDTHQVNKDTSQKLEYIEKLHKLFP